MHDQTVVNIIIADDHQLVVDGIKSMLAGEPLYKIVGEASNGQEALDKITACPQQYHILLTDISMPLLSGIDLCKAVKHQHPHIKVLVLSMYNSAPIVKEAIAAESDGFILKNSGKEELLHALYKIGNDGTYYSDAILPILYSQVQKEKKQKQELAILTERELEILKLIVREYTSEEIAQKLFISKKTVDNHRANILEKTQSKSTIGLVKFAIRNGIE